MKKNLRGFTLHELEDIIINAGFPVYRAVQIFHYLHSHRVDDIALMKTVSRDVKKFLEAEFEITMLKEIAATNSVSDNTRKFLFEAAEGKKIVRIETVLICEDERRTVCVSTQAGCKVGCEFCATGKMKFGRNLTAGEIVSQVYDITRLTKEQITNVVFMGMGEPLMNYDNVINALLILTDQKGCNIPSRKITISTVGFKNKIRKLADDITSPGNNALRKLKLALSLHTTDKGLREVLIPTSKLNPLSAIYEELIYFYKSTGTKLTYEYIHFEGINDTPNEIKRLTKLSRMIPCNVNIIPFHPVSSGLTGPFNKLNKKIHANIFDSNKNSLSKNKLNGLIAGLRENNVVVNLRTSSGVDINAACGQLAVMKSKNRSYMHQLIIFGPPGVGKGTQAELISEKLNLFHLSTGEYLRKAIAEETELGKKAKVLVESGSLVPDDIMIAIVREALEKNITAGGFILDGFPRTLEQAVALGEIFEEMNFRNVRVLHLTVPQDQILERLIKRGRVDDTEKTILHRLRVYENLTKKVIDHYKEKSRCVIEIDGSGGIEEINKTIHILLGK